MLYMGATLKTGASSLFLLRDHEATWRAEAKAIKA